MMKPQVEKVRGLRSDSKTGHWNQLKTCAFTGLLLAGPYPDCQPEHLHLGPLLDHWASSQYGGWVPRARVPGQPGGHWLDWPQESHSLACTVITYPFRVTGRKKGHHL